LSVCKRAIGVAEEMKEKYGDRLDLRIYTIDSKEQNRIILKVH